MSEIHSSEPVIPEEKMDELKRKVQEILDTEGSPGAKDNLLFSPIGIFPSFTRSLGKTPQEQQRIHELLVASGLIRETIEKVTKLHFSKLGIVPEVDQSSSS